MATGGLVLTNKGERQLDCRLRDGCVEERRLLGWSVKGLIGWVLVVNLATLGKQLSVTCGSLLSTLMSKTPYAIKYLPSCSHLGIMSILSS